MKSRNTCCGLLFGSIPKQRGFVCVWIFLSGTSHLATSERHTLAALHTDRNSTSGEHLVIIGKPFEGCQYSDGGEAGLLNMERKTQPAWQHTPLNDLVN